MSDTRKVVANCLKKDSVFTLTKEISPSNCLKSFWHYNGSGALLTISTLFPRAAENAWILERRWCGSQPPSSPITCLQEHCPHPRACQARSPWGSQKDEVTSQHLPPQETISGSGSSCSGSCSRSRSLSLNVSSVSSMSSTSSSMCSVQSVDSGDTYANLASPGSSASSQSCTPVQTKKEKGLESGSNIQGSPDKDSC
ncbi:zinc finger CCCH domain-containing protein 18 isoform X2 [Desmodus rotundus]|uniref:zinc finger CCCH domain-containing protein 18 isoform X2 n=1 Tax=Desmodus rotundus TaxID=9430 RepID=UPI00238140AC|nr:zinc finger CCCH domain-containing protein 18 isoform X2 [Desmodus rotundus]